jgi:S-adenosylmethionine:tRNA ribosyltransferase-isomerase
MKAASGPRSSRELRVLVVDAVSKAFEVIANDALATLFAPGDLLVVNDAATLPASFHGHTEEGEELELRLVAQTGDRRWTAALFGGGDWRTRTEDRPAPPAIALGDRLHLREGLVAVARGFFPESARLVEIDLELVDAPEAPLASLWSALYRAGRPVQYAHVPEPLALWDVQNVYAARPWALEMPSAGRGLRVATLLELARRGVEVARVTHAAGLSSIGDATVDALLPLPERFEVEEETWDAIARTRARGGRVVAVGTSVVRALEGGARAGRRAGITDLRIAPGMRRAIVDGILTGVHESETSHFALLGAFAKRTVLERALVQAEDQGLLGHEMGDAWLVWGEPRATRSEHEPKRKTAEGPRPSAHP